MKICSSVDRTFLVLLTATFLFVIILVFVEWKFPQEGQIFQVLSGLATGTMGAALLRIKAPSKDDHPTEPGTKQTIIEATETHVETPPDPPKKPSE